MKTIVSKERSTGMGARSFTAVLLGGKWIRVSDHPDAVYAGRQHGWEFYELAASDDAVIADFYRSNGGREKVTASNGEQWASFELANRWASGESAPSVCPHCGRGM